MAAPRYGLGSIVRHRDFGRGRVVAYDDERYVIVLRGTWYTDEGDVFRPTQTVPLKPGDFMRHPRGGPHYDGALDEDTWVAISGYGPTKATVIDGGELFGKSR